MDPNRPRYVCHSCELEYSNYNSAHSHAYRKQHDVFDRKEGSSLVAMGSKPTHRSKLVGLLVDHEARDAEALAPKIEALYDAPKERPTL